MSFYGIPEGIEPAYPCECEGNIKRSSCGGWECDTCDIAYVVEVRDLNEFEAEFVYVKVEK